jgi:glucose-1-phosphate thymidylyltransferase
MKVKAIIPAAGEGRRLKPHTVATPKALLQVAGKPIIGHIMDRLLPVEPAEVCVVTGAQGERTRRYLESEYRCRFRFLDQEHPRGLGDAVSRARPAFEPGDAALIVLGDTIVDVDLRELVGDVAQLAVKPVSDPQRFGIVELEGDRIIRLVEKPEHPASNLAIVGLYFVVDALGLFGQIDRLVAAGTTTRGEFQLTDALQALLQSGARMKAKPVEHWLDCGTREAMIETNRHLLSRSSHFLPRPGVVFVPPVFVHDSATVEGSIVGPNVSVGAGAMVRGSIIRDSIVNDRAVVDNSLLEGSILGEESTVRESPRRFNLGGFSEIELG